MPFVAGFLRVRRRGHPDQGLPGGEGPVDPEPPVGIWPPLTPEHPWRPIPGFPDRPSTGPVPPQPGPGQPLPRPPGEIGQLPVFPPGAIWPPLPPGVHGKYLALVLVAGMPGVKYRYVVIDADASFPKPEPTPPEAQPKA